MGEARRIALVCVDGDGIKVIKAVRLAFQVGGNSPFNVSYPMRTKKLPRQEIGSCRAYPPHVQNGNNGNPLIDGKLLIEASRHQKQTIRLVILAP